jgi:F-type H+-transporting ATPase subunit epsilon
MKPFNLTIAQIDGALFEGEVVSVTLPGETGVMTILHNHEPLITRLKEGVITVRSNESAQTFPIDSGVVEINASEVTVLL